MKVLLTVFKPQRARLKYLCKVMQTLETTPVRLQMVWVLIRAKFMWNNSVSSMPNECLVSKLKKKSRTQNESAHLFLSLIIQQTHDNLRSRTTTMQHGKCRMKIDSEFTLSTWLRSWEMLFKRFNLRVRTRKNLVPSALLHTFIMYSCCWRGKFAGTKTHFIYLWSSTW